MQIKVLPISQLIATAALFSAQISRTVAKEQHFRVIGDAKEKK
jgi:hypothetical protein